MTEPTDDPTKGRTDIVESMSTMPRQPSFLRTMLFLAATVVVLVGIHVGAPILNPIFFAVVLSLLFNPVYSWLGVQAPYLAGMAEGRSSKLSSG